MDKPTVQLALSGMTTEQLQECRDRLRYALDLDWAFDTPRAWMNSAFDATRKVPDTRTSPNAEFA